MKRFPAAMLATLVVITPSLHADPTIEMPAYPMHQSCSIPDLRNLSYDEVMSLLELIESDSFEERCSADELEQANRLISFLAMEGATEDEKTNIGLSIASLFTRDYSEYAYWLGSGTQYMIQPAIFQDGPQGIIFCKSWCKKQWDQTRKFVKKHKKEIIIGAIIVIAVTVVVVAAVAISSTALTNAAAGGVAAAAGSTDPGSGHSHPNNHDSDSESEQAKLVYDRCLTPSLQEQILTFKENIAQEQLAISESSEIPIEENGRIIGSLFTHKTIDILTTQATENPFLGDELKNLGLHTQSLAPQWATNPTAAPHTSADFAFSTNYTPTCLGNNTDLNTLSYQTRGDWALSSGYYAQAAQDFGKAIEIEPNDPNSYLGRGVANFELGRLDASIADYNKYVSQTKEPGSATDFSIGFAKGLPKGIYDSGEGMLLFVADFARHPIQTSEQVFHSIATLSRLVKSGEWNLIGEAISPELHQLISEWDSLSAKEKGELSGYAFGKHGADIILPGATAKAIAKGSTAAKELGVICQNLQSAEKVLILEAIAEGGAAGFNVGEIIVSTRKTFTAGEELGLTAKEMATLKQSGELDQVVGKGRDFFSGNPEMQASYDVFKQAKEHLQPYVKKPMPEMEVRNLLHKSGIPTFRKPTGIPDNYLARITEKGGGMEYVHPTKEKTSIRVMPGMPHSPNPSQQRPYVVQLIENKAIDKYGNFVNPRSSEAHIPLEEFIYQENVVYGHK